MIGIILNVENSAFVVNAYSRSQCFPADSEQAVTFVLPFNIYFLKYQFSGIKMNVKGFTQKFKSLYAKSIRLYLLSFICLSGALIAAMFSWSFFHDESFDVVYSTYQYVYNTKGSRASPPTYYLSDANNNQVPVRHLIHNCFYSFHPKKAVIDRTKEFRLGYVVLNGENIVVDCYQGEQVLDVNQGLSDVKEKLEDSRSIAKWALMALFLSGFVMLLFLNHKGIFK